jgi:hypothetical protein
MFKTNREGNALAARGADYRRRVGEDDTERFEDSEDDVDDEELGEQGDAVQDVIY